MVSSSPFYSLLRLQTKLQARAPILRAQDTREGLSELLPRPQAMDTDPDHFIELTPNVVALRFP